MAKHPQSSTHKKADEPNSMPNHPHRYQRLPSTEAAAHFNQKSLLKSTNHYEVLAYEHAIAFTVAGLMEQDLLQDTYSLMQKAIKDGMPFNEFKKQLLPSLAKKGWLAKDVDNAKDYERYLGRRLKTIYHTNKQTAYATGRWQRIQNSKEGLPYLQYMPSLSTHQRDEHKRYYGLVRPVDDPIWASIFPPNSFGCKCWVKQLSTRQAQKIGISKPITLETDTVQNPNTGEMIETTKGVHFSFNHNHDRLTALIRLGEEKHGSQFTKHLKKDLGEFMLDLVASPNFNQFVPTVVGEEFTKRFLELQALVKNTGGDRQNSMVLRKELAKGENYAVATISPEIKEQLNSKTNIVWLSDDTIIKMMAHHPELDLLPTFKDTHLILKNAELIVKDNDTHISYFRVGDVIYQATIKVTGDREELYLLTIFHTNEKELKRIGKKTEKIILDKR